MLNRLLQYSALLGLLLAGEIAVATSCTLNSLTSSPTMPARIVVAGAPASGKIIFGMSMYADITCTWTELTPGYIAVTTPFGSTASPLVGAINASGVASASPVATILSGSCVAQGLNVQSAVSESDMQMSIGKICRYTSQFSIYFIATGGTPSGSTSSTTPTLAGVSSTAPYWLNYAECLVSSACIPISHANGFTTTFVSVPNTCTVNSSSQSQNVTLPAVSAAQLGSAGNVVGQTPFSISLNCNATGGSFGVSTVWNFTEGGAQNIIANTGTGTGFGFQMNDANNSAVLNGVSRPTIAAVTNGVNLINYSLAYYTTGKVSAGSAIGTATFTLTYN
jgi:major type 1 subunit fimbrin (pilin)